MERLQGTAARALQDILHNQPTTSGKVAFAWQIAAGPAMGRAAVLEWSHDGTLRIRARDEAWRREIRRSQPIIAERMSQLLGPDVIRQIVID